MLITGSDATVLMLHEEMRTWKQRGVTFTLATDGAITIMAGSADDQREAQNYRSRHADALRAYLAFVDGRDPDEAIQHLEFAWKLRQKCVNVEQGYIAMSEVTPYPNKPIWVQKIDREIEGLERERDKQQGMVREYDTRIEQLKDKRREWTESEAAD